MPASNIERGDVHAEVLVLGAGPGGYTAAFRAADLGKQVAMVDSRGPLGGVCLNVGCIPSKALLHAAKVIAETKEMAGNGLAFAAPTIDLDALRGWKDGVVTRLTGGLAGLAKQRNVTTVVGTGRFTSPNMVEVTAADGSTSTVSFEQAIIAAGSEPVTLPFVPHDDPRVIDSTGALELDGIPERLLVLGGGIIGLEMATVYYELGSKVSVVELMDQLIPGADEDLVTPLTRWITKHYEDIWLKTKVTAVDAGPDGLTVYFEGGKAPESAVFDKVLVAVGRQPNGKVIGAEAAGVLVDERGFIPVDKQQRTNVGHIFAIGDVVGQPMLAHKATHEGKVAAEVTAGHNSYFDATVIPSVAYTDPEVAWVGVTENEAKAAGVKYGKGVFPWAASGRSLSLGRDEGIDQGALRRGHRADHRLRHRRPQRRRPDRRGRAGHRDGRGRRRHRRSPSTRTPPSPRPSPWPPKPSRAPSPTSTCPRRRCRDDRRRCSGEPVNSNDTTSNDLVGDHVTGDETPHEPRTGSGTDIMSEGPYELIPSADGYTARIHARGHAVLASPTINRGTAFTLAQRRELGLTGLLPTGVTTLDGQLRRIYAQYLAQANDLRKWVYLANLRDRNEVLFYRLLSEHIAEMLPVVYTPTVGLAIERFSHEFRRTRGVYLSVDHPEDVETALRNTGLGADDVDLLVATDSEGILGIGDQGVGGIEISIGKLAVYTAAAGIHPHRVLPVVLDMGTDNLALLNDEMYLGARHARVRDHRYDELIDAYVTAVTKLFPHAMLHWEDFGATNARRILNKYADQVCTFNDDMQGTAAVVLAAAFSAVAAAGTRMRDQRVVIHGAGTAGLGIADMMRDQMIREGLPTTRPPAGSTRWAAPGC